MEDFCFSCDKFTAKACAFRRLCHPFAGNLRQEVQLQQTSIKSMFDSLLGQLAGDTGMSRSPAGGQNAGAGATSGGSGGLGDLLSSLTGGGATTSSGRSGGLSEMLGGLVGDQGSFAKGAAAGGLAGALLGGKGLAKGAVAAAIGTLAYKAYNDWQAGRAPASADGSATQLQSAAALEALPSPQGTDFMPDDPEELAEKLARAMVAAAKADGEVTPTERARITAALKERGYDDGAAQVVTEELAAPLDVGRIAALAANEAEAAEIYAASLLSVDPEGAAEKGYLAMLAARLKLPPDLVAHLHANAGALA